MYVFSRFNTSGWAFGTFNQFLCLKSVQNVSKDVIRRLNFCVVSYKITNYTDVVVFAFKGSGEIARDDGEIQHNQCPRNRPP